MQDRMAPHEELGKSTEADSVDVEGANREIFNMSRANRHALMEIESNLNAEAQRIIGDLRAKIMDSESGILTKFAEIQIQHAESVEALIDSASTQIEYFKNAKLQYETLRSIISLWENKARAHKNNFIIACAVFGVVLIATMIYIFIGVNVDTPIGQTDGWLRTAKAIAPVVLLAWVLKIISRFILQNFALMDDAKLRAAIADTFLGLVAEKNVEMNEGERGLALHALFRPPANNQEAEVAPPSLVDILKISK